jgi:amino acid adenylation domain-containing protein
LARIGDFNRTEVAFPDHVTIRELFERTAAECGSRPAVISGHATDGSASLTFPELNERANQVAHLLRAEGVGRGDIVALMVERSYAMIVGVLGVMKAGAAYLPIAPDSPAARIRHLLEDANSRILLVQSGTTRELHFGGRVINLDDPQILEGPTANPTDRSVPTDLAYVIYTSGSTGKPKGVMVEHRSLVNRLDWMQRAYPIDDADVVLQKTPYYFDVSVWELLWPLLQGAQLCFLLPGGEKHPVAIVQTVKQHRVSVMHFVPSMLNVFLEYLDGRGAERVRAELGSVRRVFASGEALTPRHVRDFNRVWGAATGAHLVNLYGPTEATVDVSYFDCPTGEDIEKVPIGRPIQNTRFRIMRGGEEVAIGEEGELYISGVGLARGYLNDPDLTAEKFLEGPGSPGERAYRTGDIARWLPDGNVEYLGREDDQVKIRGLRIELGEIEAATRTHPAVRNCVATVKRYSESLVLIVGYVVFRTPVDVDGLLEHLREQLPHYMVPNVIQEIDEVPLTPTGKANRKALPEPIIRTGSA